VVKFFRFIDVISNVGTTAVAVPAMRQFDNHTLEFDDEYTWQPESDDENSDEYEKNLVRSVDGYICPGCHMPMRTVGVDIPPSTWVLIVEITKEYQDRNPSHLDFPKVLHFNGERFIKSWISYLCVYSHFVSMHQLGGHWFYYDDNESHPKLVRVEGRFYNSGKNNDMKMQRIFYYRDTRYPIKECPHRCLEYADSADLVKQVRGEL
jgi:hypothetical protein